MTNTKSLGVGDTAPYVEGRTDERTPIALSDFHGRPLAVFLMGKGFGKTHQTMFRHLSKRTADFLDLKCSPIIVSGEPVEVISAYQESEELPYLLITDTKMAIHGALAGPSPKEVGGVWLFDSSSKVIGVVPPMGPKEQVGAALAALIRILGSKA